MMCWMIVLPLGFMFFVRIQTSAAISDCPLDLSGSNITTVASICSNNGERGKCCRYINALVAVSVSRYANSSSELGVSSDLSETCLRSITETLKLYGVPPNATTFCGLGTKIPVNYECEGRRTVAQMLQPPTFENVSENCKVPLLLESNCRKCVTAGILYLRQLIVSEDNLTMSTCRDATFTALASQFDSVSAISIASCFFSVPGLGNFPDSETSPPQAPPSSLVAASPNELILGVPQNGNHHHHHGFHLTVIPSVGIAITVISITVLVGLIYIICGKSKELHDSKDIEKNSSKIFHLPRSIQKFQEGPSSMFYRFSYKETKKATNDFSTVIGLGGFGTVYKAEFKDGFVAAVKRMNKVSEQGNDEFCREIELLARLHQRHLVALKGFCVEKKERFLIYEYMENGSLNHHLHSPERTPLSWQARIQIAIDVANALGYLHLYCNPPLCHRDIKSMEISLPRLQISAWFVLQEMVPFALNQ